MTRKFDESRRRAFLDVLAETGNQTIAAERAKVSQSWVTLHRSTDPGFRAAIVEAREKAKQALGALRVGGGGTAPPSGWGSLDGADLVVRGTNGRRVQIARSRLKQWCPRTEERFLATLAATCNVKAACAEVGLTPASAYNHRNRWRAFADRWDEALDNGYARLELALVETAGNMFSGTETPLDAPMPPMRVDEALHLLHMYKHRMHGIGGRPGLHAKPDWEEIARVVTRKVEAMERGKRVSEAQKARDEREWALRRSSGQALRRSVPDAG